MALIRLVIFGPIVSARYSARSSSSIAGRFHLKRLDPAEFLEAPLNADAGACREPGRGYLVAKGHYPTSPVEIAPLAVADPMRLVNEVVDPRLTRTGLLARPGKAVCKR